MNRSIPAVFCLMLAGCGATPHWLVKANHTSNPADGAPFNERCDATADYVGAGAGASWARLNGGSTEINATLGAKRVAQCVADARRSGAIHFEIEHKIPMRRSR